MNRLLLCVLLGWSGVSQGAMKVLSVPGYVPAPEIAVVSQQMPTKADTYGVEPRGYFVVAGAEGNPALGILFGPLGIVANVAHIKKENERSAGELGGILTTDLAAMLRSAPFATGLKPPTSPEQFHFELVPVGYLSLQTLVKTKNQSKSGKREKHKVLAVSCALSVYLINRGNRSWHARYQVLTLSGFPIAEQLDAERILTDLRVCFDESYRIYSGHVSGRYKPGGLYKVRGYMGAYKTPLIESELPERVLMPDPIGLTEWPKDSLLDDLRH